MRVRARWNDNRSATCARAASACRTQGPRNEATGRLGVGEKNTMATCS